MLCCAKLALFFCWLPFIVTMTMTKITQIKDKGATVAWSPCPEYPDTIALGTKDSGGIGFEDTGGELDLYDLNLSSPEGQTPEPKLLGSVKTKSRFASVSWTKCGSLGPRFSLGIIAGGMTDGTVHLWNPKALMQDDEPFITSLSHGMSGPIRALQFSPLNPTQLAAGGANGQVMIADITTPERPNVFAPCDDYKQNTEITAVAWNTQVAHIVASAAGDGSVTVWDLNSRKAWCELRCETSGQAVADICWNPTQGLHLITASSDDRNPVMKLWDLRASTSMPLTTLQGHSKGILKIAWCPHDESLLLSCGKDNQTLLWDVFTLQPIAEIPNDIPQQNQTEDFNNSQSAMFGANGLAPAQQRRYDVQWSPMKRGVLATCSLDRKVQLHSVLGLATKCGRPPQWMKPSSAISCGYGGTVVSVGNIDRFARIQKVVEQPALYQASNNFEAEMAATNVVEFCHNKSAGAKTKEEQQTWGFMRVIFESNARQQLIKHLGFDAEYIAQVAKEYTEDAANGIERMSLEDKRGSMSRVAENAVKEALLVGNFEAAVECCFRTGNLADALLLASCGGAELWTKTQERYFAVETPKRPFLNIVSAIIRNQLEDLVANSDPVRWEETLALLSTYGQSDEFPKLCIALGERLEAAGDNHSANLCYMCSLSLDHAVKFWMLELETANKKKKSMDLKALHEFVVKVTVFTQACGGSTKLTPQIADLFTKYAEALAEQGLLITAAKYCRGDSEEAKILRDRLYRSRASQQCLQVLGSPPPFPFSLVQVGKSQGQVIVDHVARKAEKEHQLQQQQYDQQQQQQQQQYQQEQQQQKHHQQSQNVATGSATYGQGGYTQQQYAQGAQSNLQSAPAVAAQLPPGWMALQDPSSGRTYYANQNTGETTWDPPQSSSQDQTPANSSSNSLGQAQTRQYQSQYVSENTSVHSTSSGNTNSKLVSKYGDGFVSSASHPELAYQYGNVGTSNPYAGGARPGTAQVAPAKAPVSGTPNYDKIDLPVEYGPMKDGLLGITGALGDSPLTSADKRQLGEAEKGVAILVKRLARGDIDTDVSSKVSNLVHALQNKDFNMTAAIQKQLVNEDWQNHKDWLKGIKFLITLASKKL